MKRFKKVLSIMLVISMVLSACPMAFAETPKEIQAAKQIEGGVNPVYYTWGANGFPASSADTNPVVKNNSTTPKVTVSKTIAGTAKENEFDITLKVETTEDIVQKTSYPDAAVVMVMDYSGSMDWCATCGSEENKHYPAFVDENNNGYCDDCWRNDRANHQHTYEKRSNDSNCKICGYSESNIRHHAWAGSRLEAAQDAAENFLRTYAGFDSNGNFTDPGACRYVSLVMFWGSASLKQDWFDLHSGVTGNDAASKAAAENNLLTVISIINNTKTSNMTNPTAALQLAEAQLEAEKMPKNAENEAIDNKFVVFLTDGEPQGKQSPAVSKGGEYDWPAGYRNQDYGDGYDYEALRAYRLRNALGAKFYSVAFGLGNSSATTVLNKISDASYTAESANQLQIAFENIITLIQLEVDAWKVNDPMGQYITLLGNYSSNGGVKANANNDGFEWDLRKAQPVSVDNTTGKTTYALTYRVALDVPQIPENSISEYFKTNGRTTLTYFLKRNNSTTGLVEFLNDAGTVVPAKDSELTIDFKVPAVKGYKADLSFIKQGYKAGTLSPLSGAAFTVTSDAENNGTAVVIQSSTSGTDGKIAFTNLPSGDGYTLSETNVPAGFDKVADVHFDVKYGEIVFAEGKSIGETVIDPIQIATTDVTFTKTWKVPATESIPESITVTLLRDGSALEGYQNVTISNKNCTVDNNGVWTYSFKNLPETDETGKPYVYTVKEAAMTGYTTTYDETGRAITNTASGKVHINAEKTWILPEGMAAPEVKVWVTANGEKVGTSEMTFTNNKADFGEFEKYDSNGQLISYAVVEDQNATSYQQVSSSYTTADYGDIIYTFTNTVAQEKTSVSGTKSWKDGNDTSSRPETVTVTLYADGVETTKTANTSAAENWKYSFTDLDRYAFTEDTNGNIIGVREIKYTVKEDAGTGYTPSYDGMNVTNTRTGKVNFIVNKTWVDIADEIHGDVTVSLYANVSNDALATKTFSESAVFENLDKYDSNGALINYSITETAVSGYTATYSAVSTDNDGNYVQTVTNTRDSVDDETVALYITKVWQQPEDVEKQTATFTVTGTLKNTTAGAIERTETITGDGTKTLTYPKFYRYEEDGEVIFEEYEYSVEETGCPANYKTTGGKATEPANTWMFVNTITGTTSVTVRKEWVKPESVDSVDVNFSVGYNTIDGEEAVWNKVGTIEIEAGETSGTLSNLAKYNERGQEILYTVKEDDVIGFSVSAPEGGSNGTGFEYTVTNTVNAATLTKTISKTWIDGSTAPADRPEVTLTLIQTGSDYADITFAYVEGKVMATVGSAEPVEATVSEDNNTYSVKVEVPRFSEDKTLEYTYTLEEYDAPSGYTKTVDGLTATNKRVGTIDKIEITKYWVDPADTITRPEITLKLTGEDVYEIKVKDGVATMDGESLEVAVSGSTWTIAVTNLPEFDKNGNKITYTLSEDTVPGYTQETVEGQPFAITNRIEQEKLTIEASKEWANMDVEGVYKPEYPAEITVALYRDGLIVEDSEQTVAPDENGVYNIASYTDYDKYASDGHIYEYEVMETKDGAAVKDGGTISFGENNSYVVTYGEDGTITNTYQVPAKYMYIIETNYTHYSYTGSVITSHSFDSDMVTKTEPETVTVDPDDYKVNVKGDELTYEYDAENAANVEVVTLEEENHLYKLVLNYVLTDEVPYAQYGVVHEYYTNGSLDGSSDTSYYSEKVGTVVDEDDVEKVVTYDGNTYEYTSASPESITVYEDGIAIITLRYDRTYTPSRPHKPVEKPEEPEEEPEPIVEPEVPEEPIVEEPEIIEELPEEEVPLAGLPEEPEELEIFEEEVPLADVPTTGDHSVIWFVLSIMAAFGLAVLTIEEKKARQF